MDGPALTPRLGVAAALAPRPAVAAAPAPLLALAVALALFLALPAPVLAQESEPSATQIRAAKSYLKSREGRRAFAVIDSRGRLSGVGVNARFVTASVVKTMLLVEYLRRVARQDRDLSLGERALLDPMIRLSSNSAATAIYRRVGNEGLRRVARIAGMTKFRIAYSYLSSCRCSSRGWARAEITAADQARLHYRLDRLLPERFRLYAKALLEGSAGAWWGIPRATGPLSWRAFFKVGLRSTGLGWLVHQAARLERDGSTIALVVLTDANLSYDYGRETVFGVAWLLAGAPAAP